ncbi:MAG: hypothetical protein IJ019_04040 [Alphaproteobacteria bacterium]|nr:hypothetical protein [Alphaproteobacteria bacterium]
MEFNKTMFLGVTALVGMFSATNVMASVNNYIESDTQNYGNETVKNQDILATDKAYKTNLVNQIHSVVSLRMTESSINTGNGISSGDPLENVAMWAQGMVNHTKLDGQFSTDTI